MGCIADSVLVWMHVFEKVCLAPELIPGVWEQPCYCAFLVHNLKYFSEKHSKNVLVLRLPRATAANHSAFESFARVLESCEERINLDGSGSFCGAPSQTHKDLQWPKIVPSLMQQTKQNKTIAHGTAQLPARWQGKCSDDLWWERGVSPLRCDKRLREWGEMNIRIKWSHGGTAA